MNGYLTVKEIDELTAALICDYMRKMGQSKIECVDIEGFLVDYLGYRLVYENIAEDDDNKIAFKANGVAPLKVQRNHRVEQIVFPENTVVLDRYLLRKDMSGTRRFTIGHECGHIIKERLYNTGCSASYYRDATYVDSIPKEELAEYFKMEEAQANTFSAGLLMPQFLIEEKLSQFHDGKRIPIYGTCTLKDREKGIIKSMADSLGVSYMSLFYRLRDLKLFRVHGMDEYIRGELGFGGEIHDKTECAT